MFTKKRATIKEVARAAGVSMQTVSRVLNDRPDVSAETRRRIQDIILELGYSPNVLARGLIQGRTHTIGVVGYGLSYYGPARVLTGIERRANEVGYSLLLSLLREPETDQGEEIFQNLLARQVDGIIWAVPEIGANLEWVVEQHRQLSVPMVFINMQPATGIAVTAVDNFQGGRMAGQHLIDQGCRKIGIITGPLSWWESRQRLLGWRDALHSAGLPDSDSLVVEGDWYPASGAAGMDKLLCRHPDLEAVFASNDPMAVGAMQTANRLGRSIPESLAIVGYDDVPEAAFYSPALTTIRQPLVELGALAVDTFLQILADQSIRGSPDLPGPVWIQPQLVIRESTIRPGRTGPVNPINLIQ